MLSKRYITRIKQALKSLIINDTWLELKPCDVLLMAHENDRSYLFDGLLYSQLIDTLGWFLGNAKRKLSIQCLSLPFSYLKPQATYGAPKLINRSIMFSKVQSRLFSNLPFVKINPESYEIKLWLKVLELTSPKIIIAIQPHPLLCSACRIRGIKVFDYQHGVISEAMPEYGSVSVAKISKDRLPTGYLCWDEESADVIRGWALAQNIDIFVHGNPWMSRFFYQHPQDQLVIKELNAVKNGIDQMMVKRMYAKVILVTLQPWLDVLYPNSFSPGQFIYQSFMELLEMKSDDILWLIRLHPIQWNDLEMRNKIIKVFSKYKNVEVVNATKAALPAILVHVNGHLTWNSNVVTEASWLGVHSFIMDAVRDLGAEHLENDSVRKKMLSYHSHIEARNLAVRAKTENCAGEIKKWLMELGDKANVNNLKQFCVESFIRDLGVELR